MYLVQGAPTAAQRSTDKHTYLHLLRARCFILLSSKMAPGKKAPEISLKALVFADVCDGRAPVFDAVTQLHNAKILSWQLAALARYGVKEVVVLSTTPVEMEYNDPLGRIKIEHLCQPSWQCEGDALREVETRADLRPTDDFVLVRAGAVFNIPAKRLVEEHKKRRAKDRNWLTTTVLDYNGGDVAVIVGEDGALRKFVQNNEEIALPMDGNLEIYSRVNDCGIDVCAPEFLLEFKENFDFDTVRALTVEKLESGDAETMGNLMYARFVDHVKGEYANRAANLDKLAEISRDLLFGWMSPISIFHVLPKYAEVPGNLLTVGNSPKNSSSCRNSVIGTSSSLAPKASIASSVLGNNVTVGHGATIINCIVLDNAVIESGASIENSIVSSDVVIKKGAKCPTRCVLDQGITVGENFKLEPGTLVTKRSDAELKPQDFDADEEDDEDDADADVTAEGVRKISIDKDERDAWNEDQVGVGGVGRAVTKDAAEIDPFLGISQEEDFEDDDDEVDLLEKIIDEADDDANSENFDLDKSEEFQQELIELLEKARIENVDMDNTLLEAHSLRMTYDVTFSHMLAAVCVALTRNAIATSTNTAGIFGQLQRTFVTYKPLTEKYIQDDAVDVIYRLVKHFADEGKILSQLFCVLYYQDVVEEDAILKWATQEDACARSDNPYVDLKEFIQWLKDGDEDDDED